MKSQSAMPSLTSLQLFDSCVTLGNFVGDSCFSTAEKLLATMDYFSINEALVHEFHARVLYPLEHGNQRLLQMIKGQSRLHPVWVLEPPIKPGRQPAQELVERMLTAGVRVARLRLSSKGALPWVWDDLCAVLEAYRIPCFFDFGSQDSTLGAMTDRDVDTVRQIAIDHSELPIILSHVMGGLGVHPAVMYLMHRVSNVFIDITGILEYWRSVAYEISPERVLFATGMPFTEPAILVSNVQYDRMLSPEAKKLICGENLRRLMRGVR